MSVFQHPHLTRGIVKTANGAFLISRGLVEMPDDIGTSLGWQRVTHDNETVDGLRDRAAPSNERVVTSVAEGSRRQ